jgi:drug/metabolite transporter (DMT)-like permease
MELYIILAIIASFFFATSDITQKYALDNGVSNIQYIFWSHGIIYFVCISLLVILILFYPIKAFIHRNGNFHDTGILQLPQLTNTRIAVLVSGLFAFIGLLLLVFAYQRCHNVGYAAAIISCTSIFTIFLSWYFLNQSIDTKALIGCIIIIFGVYLIASTNNSVIMDR